MSAAALQPDEVLLRRFPKSQFEDDGQPPPQVVFNPGKNDTEGISLFREAVVSPEQLGAQGTAGKAYWVARLTVADLTDAGAQLRPDDEPDGHVTVMNLGYEDRRSPEARELRERIRHRCIEVRGPFTGTVER